MIDIGPRNAEEIRILDELKVRLSRPINRHEQIEHLLDASRQLVMHNAELARDIAGRAITVARALKHRQLLAASLAQRSACEVETEELAAAYNDCVEAIKEFDELDEPIQASLARRTLGDVLRHQHQYRKSLECYQRALTCFHGSGDTANIVETLRVIGTLFVQMGDYPNALKYHHKMLETVTAARESASQQDAVENHDTIAIALSDIAIVHGLLEDYAQSLEYFNRAREHARRSGNRTLEVRTLSNIGNTLYAQNRLEPALEHLLCAMACYEGIGDRRGLASMFISIGNIYEKMGRIEDALDYQSRARNVLSELGIDDVYATVAANIGNLNHKMGNINEARLILDEALLMAREMDDRHLQLRVHEMLSETLQSVGNVSGALDHLRQAYVLRAQLQSLEHQRVIAELQVRFDVERYVKEMEIYRLGNEQLTLQNAHKTSELNAKTLALVERGKLISDIRQGIDNLRKHCKGTTLRMVEELRNVLTGHVSSVDDWHGFETQFDQVHPGFRQRLVELCPEITPGELRVCALLATGLESKEIANIRHVTVRTIEAHRLRIRRHLRLPKEINLTAYLTGLKAELEPNK